ncbi:hypothetical protein CB1_000331038 [Camelus ferus]|nr:hypothetical protein CB1_000331038 [Camelus ferus]
MVAGFFEVPYSSCRVSPGLSDQPGDGAWLPGPSEGPGSYPILEPSHQPGPGEGRGEHRDTKLAAPLPSRSSHVRGDDLRLSDLMQECGVSVTGRGGGDAVRAAPCRSCRGEDVSGGSTRGQVVASEVKATALVFRLGGQEGNHRICRSVQAGFSNRHAEAQQEREKAAQEQSHPSDTRQRPCGVACPDRADHVWPQKARAQHGGTRRWGTRSPVTLRLHIGTPGVGASRNPPERMQEQVTGFTSPPRKERVKCLLFLMWLTSCGFEVTQQRKRIPWGEEEEAEDEEGLRGPVSAGSAV